MTSSFVVWNPFDVLACSVSLRVMSLHSYGSPSPDFEHECGQCRRWQTAGGPGRYTNAGMVREEWLWLAPQAYGRGEGSGSLGHCWHLASPGVSMASRLLLVCSCSPGSLPLWFFVSSRLPLQTRWLLNEASSASLLLCVIVMVVGLYWGRLGRRLGIPRPLLGAVYAAGVFGCFFGIFVSASLFWGRLGRGLGIPQPILAGLPRGRGLVVSCVVSFSSGGLCL